MLREVLPLLFLQLRSLSGREGSVFCSIRAIALMGSEVGVLDQSSEGHRERWRAPRGSTQTKASTCGGINHLVGGVGPGPGSWEAARCPL